MRTSVGPVDGGSSLAGTTGESEEGPIAVLRPRSRIVGCSEIEAGGGGGGGGCTDCERAVAVSVRIGPGGCCDEDEVGLCGPFVDCAPAAVVVDLPISLISTGVGLGSSSSCA